MKSANSIILTVLIVFFLTIAGYVWYDALQISKHIEECKKQCYPDIAVEMFSTSKCVCKKLLKLEDNL